MVLAQLHRDHPSGKQTALQFVPASVNQLSRSCNKARAVIRRLIGPILGILMIFGLFRKRNNNIAIVDRQYAILTAAARHPRFYTDLDVPDTVMGRFEMLSVVMILYFRRTRASATSGQEIAQEIVDAFFQDIDHSIRELGIGDTSVPKRMKKFAGMFYGRLEAYAAAMEGERGREDLAAALARNIYPNAGEAAPTMLGLADWMISAEAGLTAVDERDIETGSAPVLAPSPVPAKQAGN